MLIKGNRIVSAGVILPVTAGISRYGTRHLAALGITERFDRCICVVISERQEPSHWPTKGVWNDRSRAPVCRICSRN